ncbi:WD40-repeat-containing domain protein [Irpex rosettiformis]|uniref:WD40-repeat-containing domain protein n=1 Tax=Irpex rosettiformis TaxID=378272 RepID=A0ACB8TU73_9APHY|nr:WD40-repeat-containing domain protein [Irpex rosettiformis]
MTVEATALSVHRCRFVDYTPSAVTALAFPPLPLPSTKGKKKAAQKRPLKIGTLAVGRANGNIELCEWTGSEQDLRAPQAWVVSKTIPGPYSSKVDSLAFTLRNPDAPSDETPSLADLRLFSAGGGSELAEWDIEKSCIRRTLPSQGGSIWCISPNPASTLLAIGCEDGAVRIISLEHDSLIHLRRFDRVKSRILSIAWGPPAPKQTDGGENKEGRDDEESEDEDEDEWKDEWVVAGCSDSSLRKWDVASGRVTDRMGTDKMRGERTLVWTVQTLGDGTIVSGDSLGMVKFWDSRTCTQLNSFQAHGADVLCLTISPEGTVVYSSGVDQKVVQFSYIKTAQPSTANSSLISRTSHRWVQSISRRLHSHDVRALAIWPPHTPLPPSQRHLRQFPLDIAPILASGGLDMSVVVTPAALPSSTITKVINPLSTSTVATFEDSYHRRLAYSSGGWAGSAVSVARRARLMLCQRDSAISVWKIFEKSGKRREGNEEEGEGPLPGMGGWEPVLDMDLSVHTNLVASSISDDGKWIVVADWYETKLFHLQKLDNGDIKPKRVRDFTSIVRSHLPDTVESTGASAFAFTPDGTKLVMATAMSAYLLVIDLSGDKPQVLRRFEQHRARDVVLGQRVIRGRSKSTQVEDVQMSGDANDGDGTSKEPPTEAMNVDEETAEERPSESASDSNDSEDEDFIPLPQKSIIPTITRLAISPDGQYLASVSTSSPLPSSPSHASTSSPVTIHTHIYNLDSITYSSTLPSFPSAIHALGFTSSPTSPRSYSSLVLGLADNSIHVYDVESRTFPVWAREATGQGVPKRVRGLHDPILGVTFDSDFNSMYSSGSPGPLAPIFWGATWLCRVHLAAGGVGKEGGGFDKRKRKWGGKSLVSRPVAKQFSSGMNAILLGSGRGSGANDETMMMGRQENFKVVTTYRPILFVDFVGEKELVVVERPLVDVLAKLPPAFFKPKYGAT